VPATNFEEVLDGKTGIIFFKDYWTRPSQKQRTGDHIDLWDKNELASIGYVKTTLRNFLGEHIKKCSNYTSLRPSQIKENLILGNQVRNQRLQTILAGLATFYLYFFLVIKYLIEPVFPLFYNLFFGTYTPGPKCLENDYLGEVLALIFFIFLPASLLLSTFTIHFIKKHASQLQNKIFFFLSTLGIGTTCYITIKLAM
jgi:hypothetical protein